MRAHDPRWAEHARTESTALAAVLGAVLLEVHHIGSTAIAGIRAKPVLDLLPVVVSLAELDLRRNALEALGYVWRGEYGLPGRRYCTKTDRASGRRLIHLHSYAQGSPEITRHLAFRDYLRRHPQIAAAYDHEKVRCQALHATDSHAYSECKSDWVRAVEADALAFERGDPAPGS